MSSAMVLLIGGPRDKEEIEVDNITQELHFLETVDMSPFQTPKELWKVPERRMHVYRRNTHYILYCEVEE